MTTPSPLTVTADKAEYNVGDPIVITVDYANAQSQPVSLTVTADAVDANGQAMQATTTVQVNTSVQVALASASVTDSFGNGYAQQSLAGGQAVFAGVVGQPPAA